MFFGASAFCGIDFRYVDIARVSSSVMYCRLLWTTSAIGPNTAPFCDTPACSRSDSSCTCQSPRPSSLSFVSDGAYQFCSGIRPPANADELTGPPIMLIEVWHIEQWPRPSTRYAPRFHSTDFVGSGLYSPSLKNSVRQPISRLRLLNGNFSSCGRLGTDTGATERRYA